MKVARSVLKAIKNTKLGWRYGSNLMPTIDYLFRTSGGLSAAEQGVLKALNCDGIAITSVDQFFSDNSAFEDLAAATTKLIDERQSEISNLKLSADLEVIGQKTFNLEALGSELQFDPKCIFARFALNQSFMSIANAYFRMQAKLRYYNVWYTAASSSQARESQLWHFDREDKYILKVFLYLGNVDKETGPFTYAPGTHPKGKFRSLAPSFFMEGGVRRTTNDQMSKVYPKENWRFCTGTKGTLIFADTRGYHKGGEAKGKDRLMYTCMYTSPSSESRELLTVQSNLDTPELSGVQLKALGVR